MVIYKYNEIIFLLKYINVNDQFEYTNDNNNINTYYLEINPKIDYYILIYYYQFYGRKYVNR